MRTRRSRRLELARRIREEREGAGLSQTELARKLGLKPSSVSRIEAGERRFFADRVPDLARALGVTIERLYERAG